MSNIIEGKGVLWNMLSRDHFSEFHAGVYYLWLQRKRLVLEEQTQYIRQPIFSGKIPALHHRSVQVLKSEVKIDCMFVSKNPHNAG